MTNDTFETMWSSLTTTFTNAQLNMVKRLHRRFENAESFMECFERDCWTTKMQELFRKYKKATLASEKRDLMAEMMKEYLTRRVLYPKYGQGGPEPTLAMTAYRWYRHCWDEEEGKKGDDLQHEAFSLMKVIHGEALNKDEIYALITAFFQSGKTFVAMAIAIIYLAADFTPVFVVPKSTDVRQIRSRLTAEFTKFRKTMKEQGYDDDDLEPFTDILYHSSKDKLPNAEERFVAALDGSARRCIIALKHHQQIDRLLDVSPDSRICLFIDEGHTNGGYKQFHEHEDHLHDEDVQYDVAINRLKAQAEKVILISATSANILLCEPNLLTDGIYFQTHGVHYRGPQHIDYEMLPTKKTKEEHYFDTLSKLTRMQPIERVRRGHKDIHPIHLLVHAERSVKKQHELLQGFHLDNPTVSNAILEGNWAAMTFQGEGIRLWHKSLMGQSLSISGVRSQEIGNGEHLFPDIEPRDVLEWMAENGGVERFPRIVTIAYDMADEGVSFSTPISPGWHLTHLLLVGNHNSARSAQIMFRLGGNHGDNVPLTGICSPATKLKILKEVNLHHEWIKELCSFQRKGNFQVSKYLKDRPTFENRVPKKFVTLKNKPKDMINEVKNPNKGAEDKLYKKLQAMEVAFGLDPEFFKKEYEAMLEERKARSEIIDEDHHDLVRISPDSLSPAELKLYQRVVKIMQDTHGADAGIARQIVIEELGGYQPGTKAQLTRMRQRKGEPATMQDKGLLIHQKSKKGSVTLYWIE